MLVDVHGCCVLLLLTGSVGSCNSSSGSVISMYSTVCIPVWRLYMVLLTCVGEWSWLEQDETFGVEFGGVVICRVFFADGSLIGLVLL